ncbi:MAG: hypothetical protein CMD78_03905 [Gammaproteobacteria bacterium]|nr:hypothetical protein [Gammaproteobacteria bacterium]
MDQNSIESFNMILDRLQDTQVDIHLYELNSNKNTSSSELLDKIIRLNDDEALNIDLIISIGGDGTMLQSAKLAHKFNIPITGINKGRLGFLTDINPDHAGDVIKHIINGKYAEENRLLIKTTVNKDQQNKIIGYGLNDVAIKRKETGRMIRIKVSINQNYINTHEGDGFIVASPTGSTAYALSCGGPILKPDIEALILVPICSHSLNDRPLVIPAHSEVNVSAELGVGETAEIDLDGDTFSELNSEDDITIKVSSQSIKLIHPKDYDYFNTLRTKLYWGQDKRNATH